MTQQWSMIVACDRQRAIGVDGRLPWHLPDDLKHFKALTLGHTVLMGRKTFEAIGRALPNRRNLVLSRDAGFAPAGAERVQDLDQIHQIASGDELWVIGGGEVYRLALPFVRRLEITEVDTLVASADTWFPALPAGQFIEHARNAHAADAAHAFAFEFVSLRAASVGHHTRG